MDRILVVDDDKLFRRILKEELTQAGYEVVEAGDGKEALQRLRVDHVDLAVLDYWLPDLNGLDLLKEVKKAGPGCPVVILTSHPTDEIAEKAGEKGAWCVEKPYNTLDILPVVKEALTAKISR